MCWLLRGEEESGEAGGDVAVAVGSVSSRFCATSLAESMTTRSPIGGALTRGSVIRGWMQ